MNIKCIEIILIIALALSSCGNKNDIEISAPGLLSGDVEFFRLDSKEVFLENKIKSGIATVGAAEIGLGLWPLRIKIKNAVYRDEKKEESIFEDGEFLEAIIPSGFKGTEVEVNPLTTLASCRFENSIMNQKSDRVDQQIQIENDLVARQFLISDLQGINPNIHFTEVKTFDDSTTYGILLGSFFQLAADQGITASKLLLELCSDVRFDGVFNGIGMDGVIQNKYPKFDEQVLKSKYAKAIYDFSKNEVTRFSELPIGAFSNEISLSKNERLFSKDTVNYSFDP